MKFQGKQINGFKIVNQSNDNEIVAKITEGHIETTNGYKVEIIPLNVEVS